MRVSGVDQSYSTSGSNDPSTDEPNADSSASSSGTAQDCARQWSMRAASPNAAGGNASARSPGSAGNHLQQSARDAGGTHAALPNSRTDIAPRTHNSTKHRASLHAGQHTSTARYVSTLFTGDIPTAGGAGATNDYHVGPDTPVAFEHTEESDDGGLREQRGPVLSKCPTDRGGNALRQDAIDSEYFSQVDYRESRGRASGGLCEGMVREAMRRIDRALSDQPTTTIPPGRPELSLMAAVHNMHVDTGSSTTRRDMFSRIQTFQTGRTTLGFSRYALRVSHGYGGNAPSSVRILLFARELHQRLENPGDFAYVELSLESPSKRQDYGHAILVQRGGNGHYTIFDPNNGAFEYQDWANTERALRAYMDSAFTSRSSSGTANRYQVNPFKIQVYSATSQVNRTQPTVPVPPQGPGGYGPPAPNCDDEIYRERSASSNGISLDRLFPGGAEQSGLRSPGESLATYVLREVVSPRASTLTGATDNLRSLLRNPAARRRFIFDSNNLHELYQSASTIDLANHVRHGGRLGIRTADDLVGDLSTQFSRPYIGDSATVGLHNDFAVVDLALAPQAPGSSGREPGRPIIVQRLNVNTDFARDQYELYDPNSGVYTYDSFHDLSAAIRGIYNSGYSADGGIDHATTTWFASESANEGAAGTQALSPARNYTLDDADRAGGLPPTGPLVPPRADLPDAPAELPNYLLHFEHKRSTDSQSTTDPRALFRPSTETPDEVKKRGGFSAGQTPLRDVNLQTHNFDIASHEGETDSAGYLGTFKMPSAAVDRQQHQSRDGYIYLVAPSPNMVDVNGSLGPLTVAAENHEFAAMGHIDNTQIIGWWRTQELQKDLQDGKVSRLTRNRDFRWDVYSYTRTAGAQPQLARFPMDSPAWRWDAYKPFSSPVMENGQQMGIGPKQDPNLTQANFYVNARLKVHQAAARQAAHKDFHGPMTLKAYGGEGRPYILYADAKNNLYVYSAYYASSTPRNTRQFTMGDDGRFHFANDDSKVLRVGHDGYLYVGAIPTDPNNLNGVFRPAGINPFHLVHVEDSKYLTVGKSVATPFVTNYDAGNRSRWQLTDSSGSAVTPPVSNKNSHWSSTAGTREQLYKFDRDPDSMLPPGTTQFVTDPPGEFFHGNFMDYMKQVERAGGVKTVIDWLTSHNAAWIFRDGFYAVPTGPGGLQVRTLGGKPVWQATVDLSSGRGLYQNISQISSNFRISDDVWKDLQSRESERLDLERKLSRP
ncbi:enterotoxin A family protein [Paraburkholderia sediminicola]|uniref:enterotoxin A family protein n=1 Tax=Paraburkholderia sediminicola TaxID=458836 RepID=UPI0038BD336E